LRARRFDVAVLGGGSSGAIVAARLAEDPERQVALVEAGPSDEGDARVLELGRWTSLPESELVRFLPSADDHGLPQYSRAYVLGGCGSHNQAIAFTTPACDLEEWERAGATGWGPAEMASFSDRVLSRVHVEQVPARNSAAASFVAAARGLGLPLQDFASPDLAEGVGWLRLNSRAGRRQSSSVAYLHPLARTPANLTVLTGTVAHRLVFDAERRIAAVETSQGTLAVADEVVVACGALESPKLLMLSGIGPPAQLRRHGIPVVAAVPGVGEHLIDHPETTVIWEAGQPVPTGVAQDWEAAMFVRTDPELEHPDLMFHFGTMPVDAQLADALGIPACPNALWLTPSVTRPRSGGRVELRSAQPGDALAISPRYYSDPEGSDERTIVAGLEFARRLAARPELAAWIERELLPGPDIQGTSALAAYAKRYPTTVDHPAGTCRMGSRDDPLAVVGPELKVRGVQGVRVADASIFPAMIGVNINLTCMMIGERCADLVAREVR
jgi:choline dehydrogenase-like flavoprotein